MLDLLYYLQQMWIVPVTCHTLFVWGNSQTFVRQYISYKDKYIYITCHKSNIQSELYNMLYDNQYIVWNKLYDLFL